MNVIAFKPVSAGTLRGFVDVTMKSGLTLHGCAIFTKDGKAWAAPPAKQIVGRDGTVQRTKDGKPRYEPTVSFADRATQERWSDGVIAAVRVSHPEVLG